MKILNCTNHTITNNQILLNIVEPIDKKKVQDAITFETEPTLDDIHHACDVVIECVKENECDAAMLGGAPFLQAYLENVLFENNFKAVYAFTKRMSQDIRLQDGTIQKTSVFDSNSILIKDKEGHLEVYAINN